MQHMELGAPDASGRRRPEPVPGSEHTIECDSIITAVGQAVNVPAAYGLAVSRQGAITINDSYETSVKGVYAGGDVCFGPKSAIEALRDGRKAASAIDKALGGNGWMEPSINMNEYVPRPVDLESIKNLEQVQVRELDSEERVKTFEEIELGFDKDEALREASRCWRCDWNE